MWKINNSLEALQFIDVGFFLKGEQTNKRPFLETNNVMHKICHMEVMGGGCKIRWTTFSVTLKVFVKCHGLTFH